MIRVDFNVPLDENFNITDNSRMVAALPTIQKVVADGGKAIIISHLGRPKNGFEERFSLKHIVAPLSNLLKNQNQKIEFNIEGFPSDKFCKKIKQIKPDQVTLVPDPPDALTSSFGWDCFEYKNLLIDAVKEFQNNGIRVSLFIDPSVKTLEHLSSISPDRIELHTFYYAKYYSQGPKKAIHSYKEVAKYISTIPNIVINAGHDLNLNNLGFLLKEIPLIKEVSIGHALVCDALKFGLENTVKHYLSITKL